MRGLMLMAVVMLVGACGGKTSAPPPAGAPAAAGSDLTPFQMENGIGPMTEAVALGPIDEHEAHEGLEIFTQKCSACHKMGEKYVGPALGQVTTRRTGTYIMNMILNPQEMVERHPVAKQLLAEHMTFMPNQGLTPPQARQVLEYLRTQAK